MERLEKLVTRGSGAVSPDQVDSLLTGVRVTDAEIVEVAEVAVLPTTSPTPPTALVEPAETHRVKRDPSNNSGLLSSSLVIC